MKPGKQWIALDAAFFSAPFIIALQRQFGWAGVGVFTAFLCACKRGPVQGQLTYSSELEALALMGIGGRPLVDDDGKEWTLADLWAFAGRLKQTRKTVVGHRVNVRATHWEHWQDSLVRAGEAERQRRVRAKKRPDNRLTNVRTDIDSDNDITPTPSASAASLRKGQGAPNGNGRPVVALPEALAELRAAQGWRPSPPADD